MFIPTSYPKISILNCNFCQLYKIHTSCITEGNKQLSVLSGNWVPWQPALWTITQKSILLKLPVCFRQKTCSYLLHKTQNLRITQAVIFFPEATLCTLLNFGSSLYILFSKMWNTHLNDFSPSSPSYISKLLQMPLYYNQWMKFKPTYNFIISVLSHRNKSLHQLTDSREHVSLLFWKDLFI